ncbi:hypothetical protein [Flavisolibacter ginsenosidimutans]|uniref:CcmD family protein n=1 Tax=Flavisolibacter ginsenosidimutans TaxID=661481 RepID=A0A5B8UJ66_9BACT|nr:hypothetical protein [Flavisolibacter ginsenosidimutans]QEC56442.1 hypothetical protein FSB75_11235 [Flavisolibacter ginsenosidimutans]
MKRIYFLVLAALVNAAAFAQDGGTTNVDVNVKGGGFPWLWVIGGLVFVILLVALLSGSGGTDRVIQKKTIIKE